MKLHFICTGNIFRSRLAESYAKSLLSPGSAVTVSSSGVMADSDIWGPMAWFTRRVLEENGILHLASPHWVQTTAGLLQAQDHVVFMQPFHLKYCQDHFSFDRPDYEVWNISDISPLMTDNQLLDFTRLTMNRLKKPVANTITQAVADISRSANNSIS